MKSDEKALHLIYEGLDEAWKKLQTYYKEADQGKKVHLQTLRG